MTQHEQEAEAFQPIVESLVGCELGSEEYRDALTVAGPLELDEAIRYLEQEKMWIRERIGVLALQLEDDSY